VSTASKYDDAPYIYPRLVPGYFGDSRISERQTSFILERMPVDGSLLEIGSASGVTAAIIADARPMGRVICVDTYAGLPALTEVVLRYIDWRRNQQNRSNMGLWVGDLASLTRSLMPSMRFDLIFVDADHSFECTTECIVLANPLVKPGGSIVIHDWEDPAWPMVEKAVRNFLQRDIRWIISGESHGICCLSRHEEA
jgi:predicted O-methyltransferase YrrM